MQTVCIDAKWIGSTLLGKEVMDHLKAQHVTSVALFASVQFLPLTLVERQLTDAGIVTHTTKAKRTSVRGQILGCDAYADSFEKDIIATSGAIIYVGDGFFHPKALLLAQATSSQIRPVIIWDPVTREMRIISKTDIATQLDRTRANIRRYINAKTIGILVTTKPGQQYLKNAMKLKEQLLIQGKNAYLFLDDDISLPLLENYPFIDAWVNTACPRIGFDDQVTIQKPLINIRDAYDPMRSLQALTKPEKE